MQTSPVGIFSKCTDQTNGNCRQSGASWREYKLEPEFIEYLLSIYFSLSPPTHWLLIYLHYRLPHHQVQTHHASCSLYELAFTFPHLWLPSSIMIPSSPKPGRVMEWCTLSGGDSVISLNVGLLWLKSTLWSSHLCECKFYIWLLTLLMPCLITVTVFTGMHRLTFYLLSPSLKTWLPNVLWLILWHSWTGTATSSATHRFIWFVTEFPVGGLGYPKESSFKDLGMTFAGSCCTHWLNIRTTWYISRTISVPEATVVGLSSSHRTHEQIWLY